MARQQCGATGCGAAGVRRHREWRGSATLRGAASLELEISDVTHSLKSFKSLKSHSSHPSYPGAQNDKDLHRSK
jgi:hypothetical protein